MSEKVCVLMRGIVACGKSTRAREIADKEGGLVCEVDEFFYTQVGEDAEAYDYDEALVPMARRWNLARFQLAVRAGVSPVIVDRDHGTARSMRTYAQIAHDFGYTLRIEEPTSGWWLSLRSYLEDPVANEAQLRAWSLKLASLSRGIHRVSADTIFERMMAWRTEVTEQDVLSHLR